ncbi:hypothetical protein VN97_g4019 [Penicillium thymicola]|uniref:Uncharacterized protein n=1 Tax=Penicillium thymicola TaxID=293382 RepID=A0AAI9TM82_PENTH|nr:hypothetical protein VN97_g4019 [Penicillium thymicola]
MNSRVINILKLFPQHKSRFQEFYLLRLCYGNSGIHIFCRQIFRHIQASILLVLPSFRPLAGIHLRKYESAADVVSDIIEIQEKRLKRSIGIQHSVGSHQ